MWNIKIGKTIKKIGCLIMGLMLINPISYTQQKQFNAVINNVEYSENYTDQQKIMINKSIKVIETSLDKLSNVLQINDKYQQLNKQQFLTDDNNSFCDFSNTIYNLDQNNDVDLLINIICQDRQTDNLLLFNGCQQQDQGYQSMYIILNINGFYELNDLQDNQLLYDNLQFSMNQLLMKFDKIDFDNVLDIDFNTSTKILTIKDQQLLNLFKSHMNIPDQQLDEFKIYYDIDTNFNTQRLQYQNTYYPDKEFDWFIYNIHNHLSQKIQKINYVLLNSQLQGIGQNYRLFENGQLSKCFGNQQVLFSEYNQFGNTQYISHLEGQETYCGEQISFTQNSKLLNYYGKDSMCFISTMKTTALTQEEQDQYQDVRCHQFQYDINGQLRVLIDGNLQPPFESFQIDVNESYGNGLIQIPLYQQPYHKQQYECKQTCQNGFCQNGLCICFGNYSGENCDQQCDNVLSQNVCLPTKQCPDETLYNKFQNSCDRVLQNGIVYCQDGFYKNNNKCALSCNQNQYLYENQCIDCEDGCLNCIHQQCFQCDEGYFLNNKKCIPCDNNCSKCYLDNFNNQQICQQCLQGYDLVNDECVPQCDDKQYYDYDVNGCISCPEEALHCNKHQVLECDSSLGYEYFIQHGNNKICISEAELYNYIDKNYYLFTNNELKQCAHQCGECDNGQYCKKCGLQYNYYVSINNNESQIQCYKNDCPYGYVKDLSRPISGFQFPCKQSNISNCQLHYDINTCRICDDGYHLFNGQCYQDCPLGYYEQKIGNQLTCQRCQSECEECFDNQVCMKCQEGSTICTETQCGTGHLYLNKKCQLIN